ncbi:MAG: RusA family crossover junction endodeoxyribonuclease [Lentisphaerota bacterium]
MKITIPGIPKAVQSFRFTKSGRRYQPGEVTEFKNWIKLHAIDQRTEGYTMPPDAIGIDVLFVFPFPKATNKRTQDRYIRGATIYKTTKPDLTDNLMKGLIDA